MWGIPFIDVDELLPQYTFVNTLNYEDDLGF